MSEEMNLRACLLPLSPIEVYGRSQEFLKAMKILFGREDIALRTMCICIRGVE